MSKDNNSTHELQKLETDPAVGEPPAGSCRQCNGNGFIGLDGDIVTCPRCKGTKLDPEGLNE